MPAKSEKTNSQRFTEKVMTEFMGSGGTIELSNYQRRLVQNYFMQIDQALRLAEEKRLAKSESYREALSYEWKNVHMESLALRVVACARIGLDPAQPNHVNPIPYNNKHLGKYEITFIPGYRGLELKASRYGLDFPEAVSIELVYKNDKFAPVKRDMNNPVENYTFLVSPDPFDRGEIVGGFYYMQFADPKKNRLKFYTLAELEKRKPKYASAEFWGGERDVWEYSKETRKREKAGTETIEGWKTEMLYKTIARAAYNSITIDSQKVDDNFMELLKSESEMTAAMASDQIRENANKQSVGFEDAEHEEVKATELPPPQSPEPVAMAEPVMEANGQTKAPF